MCRKFKEKKKLDTKKMFLFYFAESINKKRKFQKYITWLMESSSDTKWCEPHDHVVTTHTQRHQIPRKPSKSGLIEVWHKDNLYLGTSTIGNRDLHPTNIDSRMRRVQMMPRRHLFFDKSFFSSLENHGREIISPTHTHTQSVANKKFY
jgi:hypothetical protein